MVLIDVSNTTLNATEPPTNNQTGSIVKDVFKVASSIEELATGGSNATT
jgi:hypothetical protein